MSVTNTANSFFSFPINGAGFAILGTNDGSAKLDVYVDGTKVAENAATLASPARGEAYILSDLENGDHTIQVVVKSGTLSIDAIYALGSRLAADDDALISVKTELPSIDTLLTGASAQDLKLPAQVDVLTAAGQTLKKNITWDLSDQRFAGKEFQQASVIGTVQDGVNMMGLPLTVSVPVKMVIPGGTVYFIDSVEGNPAANATTEPFAAVKAALGDKLLNQASDQLKSDSNTWGLVDKDAGTKGHDGTADMMATGLYGANNQVGETLSYAFTLPAGEYKLISGHREWWNMNRPMKATLAIDGKNIDAGTLNLSGSSGDIINTFDFTVPTSQTLAYTITCTGSQAPVISFLAVINTSGKEHVHELTYKDNGNGKHTAACKVCGYTAEEGHTYVNGACSFCNAKEPVIHKHSYTYTDNKDGKTHTATCVNGDDTRKENHTFTGDTCSLCKYKKPAVTKLGKVSISTPSNESKGIKVTWKKVSGASGYYIQRKAGTGKWQTAKTVTKASTLSWTDTKANKNGTKYQYRICAYKSSVKGSYSSTKTIFRLTAKNLTAIKNNKGRKIALKWSKNTKASGYQIQYSANSKFKSSKAVKVSGGNKSSKTISSGLKKSKKYYVRIRCYKKSGSITSYSAWSKVKSITISK